MTSNDQNKPNISDATKKAAILSIVKSVVEKEKTRALDVLLASGLDVDYTHSPIFGTIIEAANTPSFQPSRNAWFSPEGCKKALDMSDGLFFEIEKKLGPLDPLKRYPFSGQKNLLTKALDEAYFVTLLSWLKKGIVSPKDILKDESALLPFLKENTWRDFGKVAEISFMSSPASLKFLKGLEDFRSENLWMMARSGEKFSKTKKTPFVENDLARILEHEKTLGHYNISRLPNVLFEKIQDEALIDKLSPKTVANWLQKGKGQFWNFARLKTESLKDQKDKNALMVFLDRYTKEMSINDMREHLKDKGHSSGSEPRWQGAALYSFYKRAVEDLKEPISPENLDFYFELKSSLSKPHEKDIETSKSLWENYDTLFKSIPEEKSATRALMLSNMVGDMEMSSFDEKLPLILNAINKIPRETQGPQALLQGLWVAMNKLDVDDGRRPYVSQIFWHTVMSSLPQTQAFWIRRFLETTKHLDKNPRLQILYKFPDWSLSLPAFEKFKIAPKKGRATAGLSPEDLQKTVLMVSTHQVAAPAAPKAARKM